MAEVLVGRPDLSQAQIGKEFGISERVIRRVVKQFNIGARKRGPKPKQKGPMPDRTS
jgi:transposase